MGVAVVVVVGEGDEAAAAQRCRSHLAVVAEDAASARNLRALRHLLRAGRRVVGGVGVTHDRGKGDWRSCPVRQYPDR